MSSGSFVFNQNDILHILINNYRPIGFLPKKINTIFENLGKFDDSIVDNLTKAHKKHYYYYYYGLVCYVRLNVVLYVI